jgi:hypothetical protein
MMVLIELRRTVLGRPEARTSMRALLRPAERPPALRASDTLLPR